MSEFSESYHLRSERAEDAIEILRRAGRKGFVHPPVNGWVTFVVEDGVFEADERIVAEASLPLLHYVSAEDHGWNFTLFERGGEVASAYRCEWDDEIRADGSRYSRAALKRIVPASDAALLDDFERWLKPEEDGLDELFEAEPSKVFAMAIGLEHYEWLNYDYMAANFHESPEDYLGVIEVE